MRNLFIFKALAASKRLC